MVLLECPKYQANSGSLVGVRKSVKRKIGEFGFLSRVYNFGSRKMSFWRSDSTLIFSGYGTFKFSENEGRS